LIIPNLKNLLKAFPQVIVQMLDRILLVHVGGTVICIHVCMFSSKEAGRLLLGHGK
jgi:hypothetical protein